MRAARVDLMPVNDPLPCLVLPHEDADGPVNMARDEALLDLVAGGDGTAAFRTYGWSVPTLSLGYFQTTAELRADPRWEGAPVVRRPTGGGALWHDRELTYALAVPRTHPLSRRSADLYHAVHAAIARMLADSGLDARRRGEGAPASTGGRPFLCFTDRDPEDVVAGAAKVVGSAQRRRSGAVLQHGSLLIARSPRTPELPGAVDLASVPLDPSRWPSELLRRLPEALGLAASPGAWPGPAAARARELEDSVYRRASWTHRR